MIDDRTPLSVLQLPFFKECGVRVFVKKDLGYTSIYSNTLPSRIDGGKIIGNGDSSLLYIYF